MFKLPVLPASTGQKRKFTDAPSPGVYRTLAAVLPRTEELLMFVVAQRCSRNTELRNLN